MTSSELERRPQSDLQAQWGYAKALATAGTLPKAYREKPGDVLLAMAYGEALRLHVTNVFTSVHIIDGKPSMSSELMQALIRREGHRIRTKGDAQSATCVIVRKDDPDYAYTVTWTLADARQAKLIPAKPDSGWAKYPGAMLLARAVSACARQACADVLAGVSYTPEELSTNGAMVDALSTPAPVRAPEGPRAPVGYPDALDGTTEAPERPQERPAPPAGGDDTRPRPPYPESVSMADEQAQQWQQAWLVDLDQAQEANDLEAITQLGNKALTSGLVDALPMAAQAREAWLEVQARLADA
jgi:hypothetical protein